MTNSRMRRTTPLQQLKTLHELDEGPGSSWFWILRARYRNAFNRNPVHKDLKHHDFTKATTREEIVRFYEELYEQLLDYASKQEHELAEAKAKFSNKDAHVRRVERERDIAQNAWGTYKRRFSALMDLVANDHEPMEEPF